MPGKGWRRGAQCTQLLGPARAPLLCQAGKVATRPHRHPQEPWQTQELRPRCPSALLHPGASVSTKNGSVGLSQEAHVATSADGCQRL